MKNFTVFFRQLRKGAVFSFVNIAGLSLGMVVSIFIAQYIGFEKSYNSFHANVDRIFRVLSDDTQEIHAYSAPGFAPIAQQQITGIKSFCRLAEGKNLGSGIVEVERGKEQISFREEKFAYADSSFFGFFSFRLLTGNKISLRNPNVVFISQEISQKYFGNDVAIGKSITLNNQFGKTDYKIEGVFEKFPENSDLQYDLVFSLSTLADDDNLDGNENWASLDGVGSQWLYTYIMLPDNVDISSIEHAYTDLIHNRSGDKSTAVLLQPMRSMHLSRSLTDPYPVYGNLKFMYMLAGLALIVLLIGWFNYINLSTANGMRRAKEVGIRKVVGASKTQLITQFLIESLLVNMLAFVIALAISNVIQYPATALLRHHYAFDITREALFWITCVAVLLVGSLASGAYSAFALTSFQPLSVLKGSLTHSHRGVAIRKVLVVAQFAAAVILIVFTLTALNQWKFVAQSTLGFREQQLLVIRGAEIDRDSTFRTRAATFLNSVRNLSFVSNASRSGGVPFGGYNFSTSGITRTTPTQGERDVKYEILLIDEDYLTTYNIPLKSGSNFTHEICQIPFNDVRYVMLNETAVRSMGFSSSDDAVGKTITWDDRQFEIRGVVTDYHHQALNYSITPIVFVPSSSGSFYSVTLSTTRLEEKLAAIRAAFEINFPGNPFEYHFLSDTVQAAYEKQKLDSIVFTIASIVAIVIACMGLFGLATLSVEQKTKEIGIRKVLGSSSKQIVALIIRDFLALIFVALFVAAPISWMVINDWLNDFAYHTEISWMTYVAGGVITIGMALLTVVGKAYLGASANPIHSLRSE